MKTPEPSQLRKYLQEYVIIGLCGAVVVLFAMFLSTNKYIREDLSKGNTKMENALNNNTITLNQFMNWTRFQPLPKLRDSSQSAP